MSAFTSTLAVSLKIDRTAAIALARVIRRVAPEDYGADAPGWYRAVDALSPLLPASLDDLHQKNSKEASP